MAGESVGADVMERRPEGVHGDLAAWLEANLLSGAAPAAGEIAPFPPEELMYNTTGLRSPCDFASHGVDFMRALHRVSPVPLTACGAILDFGVGVGRLARLFHGFRGRYVGMDVDPRHLAWVRDHLSHVEAVESTPRARLPAAGGSFDAVVSISVFSHLSEPDHLFYLKELNRVARPGAVLLLSVHGERALARALEEEHIFEMLAVPRPALEQAAGEMTAENGHAFILQSGHLTSDAYQYGIAFVCESYIRREWGRWFEVVEVAQGALHDFQDIVVLRAR
ncbi:class I SAM-dependent methyltransferase [Xanthobacter sediminis]|uniref:class I SAM-dependent methyltransferase n=1 Tax=Xanthobacter sediminis TaxID=3119926 RepID=UPI003728619A